MGRGPSCCAVRPLVVCAVVDDVAIGCPALGTLLKVASRALTGPSPAHGDHALRRAQICWNWTKVVADAPQRNGGGFRAFLDGSQYKLTGILRYERIFGPGFVSTGGIDTTQARSLSDLCLRLSAERVWAHGSDVGR